LAKSEKDIIYNHYREKIADFVFDEKVVRVFDDMIRRSVPGYATIIAMSKVFAQQYAQENSNLYDLGCSLGATTLAMRKGIEKSNCKIISIDNSPSMVARCKELVQSDLSPTPVEVKLADIADITIENASVVAMNFTLQFFSPENRCKLIQRIYDGLLPGGILILSEKIKFDDPQQDKFQETMHHDFKKLNGYSTLEISQKRKAIDKVLLADTLEKHYQRLTSAGFDNYHLWFQCFNFVSIVAFKK